MAISRCGKLSHLFSPVEYASMEGEGSAGHAKDAVASYFQSDREAIEMILMRHGPRATKGDELFLIWSHTVKARHRPSTSQYGAESAICSAQPQGA